MLEKVADQSLTLTDTGLDTIRYYLSARVISPKVKAALEKVIELRTAVDDIARQRADLERQREEATKDQARIRENLKTLDKSTDAYKRQLKNFDEVDERITKLGADIEAARNQEQDKRKVLETYLLSLDIE